MDYRMEGQAAYVLHSRPYRDTSLLVDFFTLEHGKCSAVVQGARRPNSRLRATIQPFVPLQIGWRGRQDLKTMSGAEPVGQMLFLTGSALICGLYVNELLERVLQPFEPHPKLFVYYQYVLTELAAAQDIEGALRTFEHRLLGEMGYGLDLDRIDPAGHYRYRAGQGLVPLGRPPQKPDMYYFTGNQLQAIGQDHYASAEVRRAAKRLMRLAIEQLLGDKPLRSRELFLKLKE
ncbi:DNA repair protein RecO [Marinobacterium arenosum]|uniref:DNA repair protein RecO n=1 Tax=Marinobacterium arenosum TaxID=2862496 RepID=UPI001C93B39F|nr:DNA repair protein RecO [Marinobacterium arenosum]MBY4676789.1 DNA repair protein RecO [Marinobacterium arenosum]